jgi:hypothetical protein
LFGRRYVNFSRKEFKAMARRKAPAVFRSARAIALSLYDPEKGV